MSTSDQPAGTQHRKSAALGDDAQRIRPDVAECAELELEIEAGSGCDPYNSTGQHLVEACRKPGDD